MAALQSDVFLAFRSVNIADDLALKAAGALAKRDDDVVTIKADITLLKWMLGFVLACQVAIAMKLFIH